MRSRGQRTEDTGFMQSMETRKMKDVAALELLPWRLSICVVALALTLMPLFAQPANTANPEAVKKADTAFRAGYAAQQAGQLEDARAHFAEVVRLAPQIAEGREALGVV